MARSDYLDFLANTGISSAHPGGFPLTQAILARQDIKKEARVLDVGCGSGVTAVYLAETMGCQVTGIDLHPLMVERAASRARYCDNVQIIQADAARMPFKEENFDFLIIESVTVFTEYPKAIDEYRRVLKKGGKLAAVEMTLNKPVDDRQAAEIKEAYGISNLLDEKSWVDAFSSAGFKEIKSETGMDYLLQMPATIDTSDFDWQRGLDMKAFQTWLKHVEIMDKYQEHLSYRIYTAEK